jgi:hypothetical protein
MPTLSSLGELSPNVVAALFGAAATLVAALINLRIAWRREVLDRLQPARASRRARRGLLVAITILVVASAVGGYAGAMYVMQRDHRHTQELRAELQQRIGEIRDTATRFELTRRGERAAIEAEAQLLADRRRGAEGVAAVAVLGPCRARQSVGDAGEQLACSEAEAVQASVCAPIPPAARVYEVVPYARWSDDGAQWDERRVALGGRLASAGFGAQPSEHEEAAAGKRVCIDAATWDSQRALEVRVVVRYLTTEATTPAPASPPVQAAVRITP